MASHFQNSTNSLFIISTSSHNTQTYPDETWLLNKEKKWKKREKADNNKGIASSSNQKCKDYKTCIIVLRHETKFSPGSTRRCYNCRGDDCSDAYPGNITHIVTCPPWWNFCVRTDFNNGMWLHKQQLNIYIRQSQKFCTYYF